jgi:hypothetical protein
MHGTQLGRAYEKIVSSMYFADPNGNRIAPEGTEHEAIEGVHDVFLY